jgi:hypothetical protein
MRELARCYRDGTGTRRDRRKAASYARREARRRISQQRDWTF